jgi:hypothetical protein
MRVRATQKGFYGGVFREPGHVTEEFDITTPEEFSSEWMEYLEKPEPAEVPAPAKAPAAPAAPAADKL